MSGTECYQDVLFPPPLLPSRPTVVISMEAPPRALGLLFLQFSLHKKFLLHRGFPSGEMFIFLVSQMCSAVTLAFTLWSTLKFGVQRVFLDVKSWPIICGNKNKPPWRMVYLPSSRILERSPSPELVPFYSLISTSRQVRNQKTQEPSSGLQIFFGFRYTLAHTFLYHFLFFYYFYQRFFPLFFFPF